MNVDLVPNITAFKNRHCRFVIEILNPGNVRFSLVAQDDSGEGVRWEDSLSDMEGYHFKEILTHLKDEGVIVSSSFFCHYAVDDYIKSSEFILGIRRRPTREFGSVVFMAKDVSKWTQMNI